jgi:predicted ATPase/DNA-binding SARP family transcriptional activator/Tfp pilus assembly protein PilF
MKSMSTKLHLNWMGAPHVELNGHNLTLETRKVTALLAYLSLAPDGARRETLAALFWPEYDSERALGNLRRVLWSLNHALGPEWLDPGYEQVRLQSTSVFVDVLRFRELAGAHTGVGHPVCPACLPALQEAAGLYRGAFLEGLTLRDSPEFDEWQYFQGEELRLRQAAVLERLQALLAEDGRMEAALAAARQWVALDRLHEPAQRALMALYDRANQRSAALRQYDEFIRLLSTELGVTPQPETTALAHAIRTGRSAISRPVTSMPEAAAPSRMKLPLAPTAFIGRRSELAEISRLLDSFDVRLISLVGPGGIGKTRLALQSAYLNGDHFSHGACFVPLAALPSAEFIPQALANALTIPVSDRANLLQQICTYLANKHILLVMDNFEHLVSGAPLLADLLQRAPGMKILVTSRERLNLDGEWVIELSGLSYPWDEKEKELEQYSAVQLFLNSARRVSSGFSLTAEDRPYLVRICHRLEGMPLGLELAASWVRALSCHEIADEIERDLDFLTSPRRDVPESHRSLRAVFERSWNLLDDEERGIVKRISVFRGGFSREAAAEIAGAGAAMLAHLVDHSLLRRSPSGRFEIHELLRQYAAQKLAEDPDEEALARQKHARYYSAFTGQLHDDLTGNRQRAACEAVLAELENVRSAWRSGVENCDWQILSEMCESLSWFYLIRRYAAESEEAFGRAVQAFYPPDGDTGQLTGEQRNILSSLMLCYYKSCMESYNYREAHLTLERMGAMTEVITDRAMIAAIDSALLPTQFRQIPDDAEEILQKNLQVLLTGGKEWAAADCLNLLAIVNIIKNRVDEARGYLEQQLAVVRRLGNQLSISVALRELGGFCQGLGENEEAAHFYAEAIQVSRDLDNRYGVSVSLDQLGFVQRRLGNFAEAERLHQESLAFSLELNDPMGIAGSYDNLGLVYRATGQLQRAREMYTEALRIRREVNDETILGVTLHNLAELDIDEGHPGSARPRLLEADEITTRLNECWLDIRGKNLLARLALLEGDLAEAERYLQMAQEEPVGTSIRAELPQVLVTLAELRAAQGRLDEARVLAEQQLANPALWAENRPRTEQLLAQLKHG